MTLIYHRRRSRGEWYIPSFDKGGSLCSHPSPNVVNISQYFNFIYKKILPKINRFGSKNGWFLMILTKFYQNFFQNAKFLSVRPPKTDLFCSCFVLFCFLLNACSKFAPESIHPIPRFQFQKYKIFQLLWRWRATKSPPTMSKMELRPCVLHVEIW